MINIETIKGRIIHANMTESEWNASGVILLKGEFGVSSDTQVIKVGNGKDLWKNLKRHTQGPKGDTFKFEDLTEEQIKQIKGQALELENYAKKDHTHDDYITQVGVNEHGVVVYAKNNKWYNQIESSSYYRPIAFKDHTHKLSNLDGWNELEKTLENFNSYLTNEINRLRTELSNRPKKFVTSIGNGSASEYTITHNLNTQDVIVSIYQGNEPYEEYLFEVYRPNANQVRLVANRAIKTNEFRLVVIG
ncbi:hyaluronate lyase N-terminal domain-containing protein [Facklamia hominis]|uniref:hyaluronate lyase N-terminal domain-containing protein n=1 Tax=Facklamia hominis TaxID=178214 RepID=UPI0038FCADA0